MIQTRPKAQIIAVGRQRSLYLFAPIVEKLRGLSHDVVFYEDSAAFGQMARAIAARLAAWSVTIQAHTRSMPAHRDDVRFVGLDELLCTSDVVCVLATLNSETKELLNAERLALLKRNAVLINTARGAIIDEPALCELARQRPDLRLALDTFTTEPLPPHSPLRDLPNAILTPHMLGHTREAQAALPGAAVESVQRLLVGQVPRYVCNPDVIPRWQARWGSLPA